MERPYNELTAAESEIAAVIVGKVVANVRAVVCGRPYSRDLVFDFTDGTSVTVCGEYDEGVWIDAGDHAVGEG